MLLYAYLFIIIALSSIAHYPILKQVLTEDDGNWFYISVFRKRGLYNLIIKNKKLYKGDAFFNLKAIFQYIYFIFNQEDAFFSKKIKYYWYIVTDLALFCCSYLIWTNIHLSLIISIIYIIMIAQPNSYGDLTYAEFFAVLPFLLSITLFYMGVNQSSITLILLSGIFASLTYQFNPIYLFIVLLPLFLYDHLLLEYAYFIGGFLFLLALPYLIILIVSDEKKRNVKEYTNSISLYYISFYYVLKNRVFKIKQKDNTVKKKTGTSLYIEGNWDAHYGIKDEINKFLTKYLFATTNTLIFTFLALVSLFFIREGLLLFFLCIIPLNTLVVFMQKSYHVPKFGFFHFPIAVLSGHFIHNSLIATSHISKAFIISLLAFCLFQAVKAIVLKLKKENRVYISNIQPGSQIMYNLSVEVGNYIKERTKKDDYIYVYGNFPSIYIISQRQNITSKQFSFPNRKQNLENFKAITKNWAMHGSPVYFVDFNNVCYDAWKANQVFDYIGVKYIPEKNYGIKDNSGQWFYMFPGLPYKFIAYRLDDYYFIQNFIERLRLSVTTIETKVRRMNRVIGKYDHFDDLRYYNEILEHNTSSIKCSLSEQFEIEGLIQKQDYDIAQNKLHKQILEEKANAATWLLLGEIAFIKNDQNSAEEFFKKSFELNPYSITLLNNLSVLAYSKGNIKAAKKYIDDVLRYCPTYHEALKNKEMIYS